MLRQKPSFIWLVFLCWATSSLPAYSKALSKNFSLRGGTLGYGLEYKAQYKENIGFRINWQRLPSQTFELDTSNSYNADGSLRTASFLIDWHHWSFPFRVSLGIVRTWSDYTFQLDTTETNTPATLLRSTVFSTEFVPLGFYFGFGWSAFENPFSDISLNIDVGLLALNARRTEWQNDNNLTQAQELQLFNESNALDEAFDQYNILPALMIGIHYQF